MNLIVFFVILSFVLIYSIYYLSRRHVCVAQFFSALFIGIILSHAPVYNNSIIAPRKVSRTSQIERSLLTVLWKVHKAQRKTGTQTPWNDDRWMRFLWHNNYVIYLTFSLNKAIHYGHGFIGPFCLINITNLKIGALFMIRLTLFCKYRLCVALFYLFNWLL